MIRTLRHSSHAAGRPARAIARRRLAWLPLIAAISFPAGAGENFSIPWYSIDSGGGMISSGGDFELSGTIGQWDATEARELSGGVFRLTGGFWGLTLEALADLLFSDRFEQED